ncbi:MAG: MOSC domain-containing protein [Desulfobacterales bacterium]
MDGCRCFVKGKYPVIPDAGRMDIAESDPYIRRMKIVSIAVSRKKGTRKKCVESAELIAGYGLSTDAHAGPWHRQVSFLAAESIAAARGRGLTVDFGDFAENIATTGIDWPAVPIGTRFRLGQTAVVEITQIGKECRNKCAIYYQAGDCIMPREGVFARVLAGGIIRTGDDIELATATAASAGQPG